jgi:hypothetical protein
VSNNNTCACWLYIILFNKFDKYLNLMLIYKILIRFKGEANKIDCLAYINNLIIKAILKSLSSSTYKDAYAFLNWVKKNS